MTPKHSLLAKVNAYTTRLLAPYGFRWDKDCWIRRGDAAAEEQVQFEKSTGGGLSLSPFLIAARWDVYLTYVRIASEEFQSRTYVSWRESLYDFLYRVGGVRHNIPSYTVREATLESDCDEFMLRFCSRVLPWLEQLRPLEAWCSFIEGQPEASVIPHALDIAVGRWLLGASRALDHAVARLEALPTGAQELIAPPRGTLRVSDWIVILRKREPGEWGLPPPGGWADFKSP